MSRLKIRKWKNFTIGSALMLGTSLGGTAYLMENFHPEKFPDRFINLDGKEVPIEKFYDTLMQKNGQWYASNENKLYNLNDLTDYRTIGDTMHHQYKNAKPTTVIDTVYVCRDQNDGKVFYNAGSAADTVSEIPNLGSYRHGRIRIRHFVSEDNELQSRYDILNNDRNCTWRHEYQHFLNARAGLNKSGQSYETKFAEMCFDEISACIAQLCEQRRQYFEFNRNSKYITNQFKFYQNYLESLSNPDPIKISKEEEKFIALGVFEKWKEDILPVYIKRNAKRTKECLNKANYNGCVDQPLEHNRLMYKMLKIDGIDFYEYLAGKEKEILDKLPQTYKDDFASLAHNKKENMTYFDKIGQITHNDPAQKYNYFNGLKIKHRWNKLIGRASGR